MLSGIGRLCLMIVVWVQRLYLLRLDWHTSNMRIQPRCSEVTLPSHYTAFNDGNGLLFVDCA